jgi:hypothetical protein
VPDEVPEVEESGGANGEALNEDVGEVESRGLGQVLREQVGDGRGILDDSPKGGRGGRRHGGDKEDLDDLESEVEVLDIELNLRQRRLSGDTSAA